MWPNTGYHCLLNGLGLEWLVLLHCTGLAIVKHIVQLHGGEVAVVSDLGKGSEFAVVL